MMYSIQVFIYSRFTTPLPWARLGSRQVFQPGTFLWRREAFLVHFYSTWDSPLEELSGKWNGKFAPFWCVAWKVFLNWNRIEIFWKLGGYQIEFVTFFFNFYFCFLRWDSSNKIKIFLERILYKSKLTRKSIFRPTTQLESSSLKWLYHRLRKSSKSSYHDKDNIFKEFQYSGELFTHLNRMP